MRKFGKIIFSVLALGVIVLVYYWISSLAPKTPDLSKKHEIQGADHIPVGSPHPEYNSNPPSSGWHYAEPAREGFYDEELPDEQIVHNLEHGDIWIAYHPRLSQEIKEELKKIKDSKMIITMRSRNEFDISLVAWGRVDSFNVENNSLDTPRVKDFILRYRNKGPERVMPNPQ